MDKGLLSVGIDVGTTSTQLIVSRLAVENRGSAFTVPEMVIGSREILYRSPVHFTPLLRGDLVDGDGIRELVAKEYEAAGIRRQDVDTGAVIITGETSRKENARSVLQALEGFAGEFVAATAGPDLESALAAAGSGAVAYSRETGASVLHMDIGGGTSNLAWIREGSVVETGCLNVGGRLIKVKENGEITYISPVLQRIFPGKVGDILTREQAFAVSGTLTRALETAAGLGQDQALLAELWTKEGRPWQPALAKEKWVLSFSGGVADCIEKEKPWNAFGDIGGALGWQIRKSRLCVGEYLLGAETIRATVIGAGCHALQLSGSTVFCRGVKLPLKNLPVACLTSEDLTQSEEALAQRISGALARLDGEGAVFLPISRVPDYDRVKLLAGAICRGFGKRPVTVAVQADMAKALGQAMALRGAEGILCLDGLRISPGSFLDVGLPVGPAYPVTVKTLILGVGKDDLGCC